MGRDIHPRDDGCDQRRTTSSGVARDPDASRSGEGRAGAGEEKARIDWSGVDRVSGEMDGRATRLPSHACRRAGSECGERGEQAGRGCRLVVIEL